MLSYLPAYEDHERVQRGLGAATMETYGNAIRQFYDFLSSEGRPTNPDGVSTGDVKDFMRALIFKYGNTKNSTRAQKRSALKSFFDYLITTELIRANPVDDVPSPKVPKTMPVKFITRELALLFSSTSDDAWGLRDLAIMKVLYAAGLRVSELARLDLEHLNDTGRYIRLHILGKGAKQRVITLKTNPAAALRHWLAHRLAMPTDHTALFISERHHARLSREAINAVLKKYAVKVGIAEADAFVHKMRATCFADMYDGGTDYCSDCGARVNVVDIYFLAAFAGHSSIETMKEYVNISDKVQKKGIPERRFSQIDKLGNELRRKAEEH